MGIQRLGLFVACFVLVAAAFGQSSPSTAFYTKIVVPTASDGCKIQISRNDISPGVDACRFSGHLEIGSLVRLISEKKDGRWMKVSLATEENQQFTIYIDRESGSYKETYSLLLTDKPNVSQQGGCDSKSKRDVIWNIGFPSFLMRDGGNEVWEFRLEHPASYSGNICGFDAATIRIAKDGAIEIGGIV